MVSVLVDLNHVDADIALKGMEKLKEKDELSLYLPDVDCPGLIYRVIEASFQYGFEIRFARLSESRKDFLDYYVREEIESLAESGKTHIAFVTDEERYYSRLAAIRDNLKNAGCCIIKSKSIEAALKKLQSI